MSDPYWSDGTCSLFVGDCLEVLAGMEAASVDAIVTDPPYGLEFMGREWDSFKPSQARVRTRTDGRTNPAEGKSVTVTPESYTAGQPFQRWCEQWARECLRILRPGGHLLAFGGTRTWHRLACAIEDAGFEIRDSMHWIYGSGFPKSLDVSTAIDKLGRRDYVLAAIDLGLSVPGNNLHDWTKAEHSPGDDWWERFKAHLGADDWQRIERRVTGRRRVHAGVAFTSDGPTELDVTAPATEGAARWEGWGTALKPAHEPIVVARKPLTATVAANVLERGTGALNIAGCRVGTSKSVPASPKVQRDNPVYSGVGSLPGRVTDLGFDPNTGRWPPNLALTHSAACEVTGSRLIRGDSRSGQEPGERPGGFADTGASRGSQRPNGTLHGDQVAEVFACAPDCPVGELDRQSGVSTSQGGHLRKAALGVMNDDGWQPQTQAAPHFGDTGGASRFFPVFRYEAKAPASERPRGEDGTAHPTVKPVDLMAWLVRLVTPPGGLVLDPFAGSGTTAEACIVEGFRCVLIEKDPAYATLIRTRLRKDIQPAMFGDVS